MCVQLSSRWERTSGTSRCIHKISPSLDFTALVEQVRVVAGVPVYRAGTGIFTGQVLRDASYGPPALTCEIPEPGSAYGRVDGVTPRER